MRLHGRDYSAASLARMAGDLAAAGGVRSTLYDRRARTGEGREMPGLSRFAPVSAPGAGLVPPVPAGTM